MIKFDARKDDDGLIDVTLSNGTWVGCLGKSYVDGTWAFTQEEEDAELSASDLREIADKLDSINGVVSPTKEMAHA